MLNQTTKHFQIRHDGFVGSQQLGAFFDQLAYLQAFHTPSVTAPVFINYGSVKNGFIHRGKCYCPGFGNDSSAVMNLLQKAGILTRVTGPIFDAPDDYNKNNIASSYLVNWKLVMDVKTEGTE